MNSFGSLQFVAFAVGILVCIEPQAKHPFELTNVFEIGGGGCIGETRIYEDADTRQAMFGSGVLSPTSGPKSRAEWLLFNRTLATSRKYFLETIGCGTDRVAISLDGKAYVLDQLRIRYLGAPVTYVGDEEGSPNARIEHVSLLYSVYFQDTECTQRFDRVRVHINFKGAKRVVSGIATAGCP
jgi:hypothetical protein